MENLEFNFTILYPLQLEKFEHTWSFHQHFGGSTGDK